MSSSVVVTQASDVQSLSLPLRSDLIAIEMKPTKSISGKVLQRVRSLTSDLWDSAKFAAFLRYLTVEERVRICHFLGVSEKILTTRYVLCSGASKTVTDALDNCCLNYCTCGARPCHAIHVYVIEASATTDVILSAIQSLGIEDFPRNQDGINLLIKAYVADIYGFEENHVRAPVTYTKEQVDRLVSRVRRFQDFFTAQKVIRLLHIGSSKGDMGPSEVYESCFLQMPGFSCCYGGSYGMARELVEYCQQRGVPHEKLTTCLDTLSEQWPRYVRERITSAIADRTSFVAPIAADTDVVVVPMEMDRGEEHENA